MPRDVSTWWNSTYEMLVFALEYHKAIDKISGGREMRKYELEEEEWKIVQQLCDILEVRHSLVVLAASTYSFAVVQGHDPLFFAFNTESRHCDTCNGSYRHASSTAIENLEYSSAIRASLALGKAHLNKYYNISDYSEVYRIAMSKCSTL